MNIYDRISLILNNENLTLSEFDRKIGVKVGYTSQVLKKNLVFLTLLLLKFVITSLNIHVNGSYLVRIHHIKNSSLLF